MESIEKNQREVQKVSMTSKHSLKVQGSQKNNKQDQNNPKRQSDNRLTKYNYPHFKFNLDTVEILIFKRLDVLFLQDLNKHLSTQGNRRNAVQTMKKFFAVKNNLEDSARLSHEILEDFTSKCPEPKVPRLIISVFVEILIKNKNKIKHILNQKGGDRLLDFIPLQFLVDVIELYDLKLSKKEQLFLLFSANMFFKQIANSKTFTEIPRFITLNNHHDFGKQLTPVIQKLISQKEYKKLRLIPNLRKLFKENPELAFLKSKMLKNTAMYHFRSEGWEYLEEIFEFQPEIIAAIINGNFGSRPSQFQKKQQYLEGVVAICQRNPKVFQKLKPDTRKVITQKKIQMQKNGHRIPENPLKIDQFLPSSMEYFSFQEFGVHRNQIIWVDDKLGNQKLKQIKEELLKAKRIGIDTESTLVRTPVDSDLDVLSLVQVSTEDKIYLFDPYHSKHPQIKQTFKKYFEDSQKLVIGHTIKEDIGGIAHFFELSEPICKVIDIKVEFQKFVNTKRQVSLKAISKQILGKEICKKYTVTNWDRRPLNLCQIHYAAMDAFILIRIWDKLSMQILQKQKNPQKYKTKQKKMEQLINKNDEKQEEKVIPEFQDKQFDQKVE